jgi:NADH dehydrogenase (ubiquinone) 1 alpha/beta subcomplex 1
LEAEYQKDLGLDSLDTVEVVMAIEEEFIITVPDQIADGLRTVKQTVDFIAEKKDATD